MTEKTDSTARKRIPTRAKTDRNPKTNDITEAEIIDVPCDTMTMCFAASQLDEDLFRQILFHADGRVIGIDGMSGMGTIFQAAVREPVPRWMKNLAYATEVRLKYENSYSETDPEFDADVLKIEHDDWWPETVCVPLGAPSADNKCQRRDESC